MKYTQFKKELKKEYDGFPFLFAFNDEQMKKGKEELKVKDDDELLNLGSGIFIRKTDKENLKKLMKTIDDKIKKFLEDDEQMLDAFLCELVNHEYNYNQDYRSVLDCFNLKLEELTERERKILEQARIKYFEKNE